MKKTLATLLTGLLSCMAFALTVPDGFVYRARCVPREASKSSPSEVEVTLRLYPAEKSALPTWTGVFKKVPLVATNNLFQIWVSEAAHVKVEGEATLSQVLWRGEGCWVGVSFNGGRECQPRRMLVTAPQVRTAVASETLDPVAEVTDLVECEDLTAGAAVLGNLVCGTLSIGDAGGARLNVKTLDARSVQLKRDGENVILARTGGDWTGPVRLETGAAVTNTLGKTAFLTLCTTETLAAPLLTVPVPAGEAFVWQAKPATCRWRFTPIGAE